MRLIDADELLNNEFKNDISFNAFQNLVKRQKTIDAVKHGEWVYKEYKYSKDDAVGYFECSKCGHASWQNDYNYCPNCGARMDGKEQEDE